MSNAELILAELKRDAYEWGGALNKASWTFSRFCPEKSVLLFNNTKSPIREAILDYIQTIEDRVKSEGRL